MASSTYEDCEQREARTVRGRRETRREDQESRRTGGERKEEEEEDWEKGEEERRSESQKTARRSTEREGLLTVLSLGEWRDRKTKTKEGEERRFFRERLDEVLEKRKLEGRKKSQEERRETERAREA